MENAFVRTLANLISAMSIFFLLYTSDGLCFTITWEIQCWTTIFIRLGNFIQFVAASEKNEDSIHNWISVCVCVQRERELNKCVCVYRERERERVFSDRQASAVCAAREVKIQREKGKKLWVYTTSWLHTWLYLLMVSPKKLPSSLMSLTCTL